MCHIIFNVIYGEHILFHTTTRFGGREREEKNSIFWSFGLLPKRIRNGRKKGKMCISEESLFRSNNTNLVARQVVGREPFFPEPAKSGCNVCVYAYP